MLFQVLQEKLTVNYRSDITDSWRGIAGTVVKATCTVEPNSDVLTRLTVNGFERHFANKVDRIRTSTSTAPSANIIHHHVDEPVSHLLPVTADEVIRILAKSQWRQAV